MRTTLKPNEKIILELRQHWFVLVLPFLIMVILLAVGIAVSGYGLLIPVIPLIYLVFKILQRKNNLWAVTTLRVVDEFGVLTLHSKESPLDKINNISYEQTVWGRIFRYGSVQIQTAAEIGSTVYTMVEKPRELKDTITRMQEEYKKTQISAQAEELARAIAGAGLSGTKKEVAAEIEKLFELKQKGIITEDEFNERKKKLLDN